MALEHIFRGAFIVCEVVLIFNLLIIVHELGHFLAARWRGLQIDKFGIWFGRPIWKKKINGIEFSLGTIPAGGFVLLPQMAPMETVEGKSNTPRSDLPPISPLDKIIVAFAGPLFSFLLALCFATIVWIVGRPTAEAETTTTIGMVLPDEPAAKAGFQPGDKILEVDGHPVSRFSGMVDSVTWYIYRSEGKTIDFKVQRGDKVLTLNSGYVRPPTSGWERKSLRQVGIQPTITPIVAKLSKDSLAAKAGLLPNDEVIAIDGQKLYYPEQIFEWAQTHPNQPLHLTVNRGGKLLPITMQAGRPIISSVIKNSPADEAGLKANDRILALNGEQIYDPTAVNKFVNQHPGELLSLTVESEGTERTVRLTPAAPDGGGKPIFGLFFEPETSNGIAWDAGGRMAVAHISPIEQVSAAVETVANTIGALLSPRSDIKLQHMSGPVMIMRTYYLLFQTEFGWQLALWLSVVFNVNLAIINLLPIPVLDGGHILLALIEMVRRRPINIKVLEVMQGACAIFLIGFMLYVSFYDVTDLPWSSQKPKFSHPARTGP